MNKQYSVVVSEPDRRGDPYNIEIHAVYGPFGERRFAQGFALKYKKAAHWSNVIVKVVHLQSIELSAIEEGLRIRAQLAE